ncbi:putative membrane protein [Neorhizobium galegae]|uniref:hypothetical protein n=1 Tax=Neorhizobium galegae TaxID=399 RepID=UPI00278164B7|nr:hypothetical protein [Neorhizobium galegae]MDQ0135704.1 putative membrane protein [Neorhizobium galegae]
MVFLVICFLVGAVFLMPFSRAGRGCLGCLIRLVLIAIICIVVGALILGGGLYALIRMLD